MSQGEIIKPGDDEQLIVQAPAAMLDLLPLAPIMNLQVAKARLKAFQEFVDDYLVDGEDYGKFPGAVKPALYKPGADKLCELYGLADDYEEVRSTRDFESGLFDYEFRCIIMRGDRRVTVGLGSCSTYESKYRFRDAARKCPDCQRESIIRGKEEYGGGWVCWIKKGGCGHPFDDTDPRITSQRVGRVENENLCDLKNTVLKMAKKRAKVDATLSATRSSGIFTQSDDDDLDGLEKAKPAATNPSGYITEPERRAVFAAAGRAKVSHDDIKKYLFENHKVDSTNKMTREVADNVIAWLHMIERGEK